MGVLPLQGLGVLHEAKLLMLNISKAKFNLGWEPKMNIDETVAMTVNWYKQYTTKNVYDLCVEHINNYTV
jgi:CDP-glucose 4,6-dehydratase